MLIHDKKKKKKKIEIDNYCVKSKKKIETCASKVTHVLLKEKKK
jgi:hypothetical protein